MRDIAINCISELIYQSTWNQSGYDNRIKGFLAESLATQDLVVKYKCKYFKGGWILPIPKDRFRNADNVLYITTLANNDFLSNKQHYCEIYKQLEKFSHKYLAVSQINFQNEIQLSDQFSTKVFPKIDIDYFRYDLKSNTFVNTSYDEVRNLSPIIYDKRKQPNTHDIDRSYNRIFEKLTDESLYDILVNRYVFDYLFGPLFFKRGIPADFDMIVYFPKFEQKYIIYEIKEKDPSKKNSNQNNVVGFGMDLERINDYATFINWFPTFQFRYLVRQIDNQKDRNFVAWRSIEMQKFIDTAKSDPDGKSGGQGMLPSHLVDGHISTAICPISKFKIID